MKILAVDTSGPVAGVAVLRDGALAYEATAVNKMTHSVNMMPMVEEALNRSFPEAKLLLQVHDELIVECPEEIAPQVAALISEQMENVAVLNVPLTAEAKFGKSWYDAK